MRKWVVRLVLLAVVGVAGWYGWRHYSRKEVVEIPTVPVVRGPLSLSVTATGRLAPTTQVLVGCEVSGTVGEIHVGHNDRVKRGQVIARLRPELFRAEHEQANAELARAQAALQQLQVQEAEAKRRFEWVDGKPRDSTSREEHASLKAAHEAAKASTAAGEAAVRAAQNVVDLTKYRLGKAEITSPIDGIVLDRRVDVGQTVAATLMTPELFVLAEDLSRMDLIADVSEADIGYVCPGQQATFTVNAYRDRSFEGRVREIRNQPRNIGSVVTYAVVIEVVNKDMLLRPGMPADITLEIVREDQALKIANAALRFRPPIPPEAVRRALDGLAWPSQPAPIAVAGRGPATRPEQVDITPPPIRPTQATLWQFVAGNWKAVPVWTGYTDNRDTLLFPGPGVELGNHFVTEVRRLGRSGRTSFEQAILMARPESRRL